MANKGPAPVVPVAQFEAFKVYEDSNDEKINKELLERYKKTKDKDGYSNVYKGTTDDRFVTKKEVKHKLQNDPEFSELLNVQKKNVPSINISDLQNFNDSPMSTEKLESENVISEIAKSKTNRDAFFEMLEYREEIYNYLREREVRLRNYF